jgi:NADPH:quinone reductase-like Zn-dependent oxidoreductase
VPEIAPPGPGEVTLKVLAGPINPAELLIFEGRYASKPDLPYQPGIEAVGVIEQVGEGVTSVAVGDKVISLGRQNWVQRVNLGEEQVIKVPDAASSAQLAMLKVNPATAWLMLTDYVSLQPGDWVVQNAANSGVGHSLIQLARANGWKTLNIVRRSSLIDSLTAVGADAVLVDGDDLGQRAREVIGDGRALLGIDAIAGSATTRLADCLDDGGTVVNYGFLSGDPCQLTPNQTVFRDISLKGFWLAKLMGGMSRDTLTGMYAKLAASIDDGTLHTPVEAMYGLEDISKALDHAHRESRDGKILLTPNGALD